MVPTTESMSSGISTNAAQESVPPRRYFLCVALVVAALANALIPAVFFSETQLFGYTDPRYRALVAVVVLIEYLIAFALLLLHANVGFASGYALATATIVTLGSAVLTIFTLSTSGLARSAAEVIAIGAIAFAVSSNGAFLAASIRYARGIHPRLHLGGFFLGIAASLAVVYLYARTLG